MTSLPSSFPRRVRIRGGEFGASARAMHRKAAFENVSSATIERKLMSTKTTLKRVALVAVAAMGLGLLSVAPSSATSQADTLTLSSTATSVTVGTAATTTLTQSFTGLGGDTMTVTASLSSAPSGNSTVPALTVNQASNTNASTSVSGGLVGTTADTASATVYNSASGVYTVTLPSTAIVGTYVVKFTAAVVSPNTGTVNAAAVTWTVTVTAASAATADATSTVYIASGTTAPTSTTDAVAVNAPMAVGTQAANILVTPKYNSASASVPLTATITGPGLIGLGASNTTAATGRSLTTGTTAVTSDYVTVWPDGTAGVATITISSGSTVLGTKTVTFYGSIATVTTTVVNSVIGVGSTGANVGAITAVAKDSLGNVVPVGTLYATSDTAGVVSNSYTAATIGGTTAGVATFTLTGVAAGTANITVGTGSSSAATGVINAAPVAVRVGSSTPASVAVTFDASSYTVGQTATVTVTLLDAAGLPVPNATYANIFDSTGLVSNYALGGAALPTTSITTSGSTGTQTFKVTMPSFGASVTLSAKGGTGLPTALQGAAITSATVDVTDANSSAAVDAANAATDAANYAADAADAATTAAQEATAAAQAAQDSADAATAAVVALGLRVDTLMASVRAQLTSLSNLLVRIIKKTHA